MAQSEKMTTSMTTSKKGVYISPEVYNWLVSILDEGVPQYDEPMAEMVRYCTLNEVLTKVKHAYNTQR